MNGVGNFTLTTAGIISLAVQFVMPVLVGLITKRSMQSDVKALLLAGLTVANQILTPLIAVGHIDWKATVLSFVLGFAMSVAVHFGLWKPVGAADAATDVGVKG